MNSLLWLKTNNKQRGKKTKKKTIRIMKQVRWHLHRQGKLAEGVGRTVFGVRSKGELKTCPAVSEYELRSSWASPFPVVYVWQTMVKKKSNFVTAVVCSKATTMACACWWYGYYNYNVHTGPRQVKLVIIKSIKKKLYNHRKFL